MTILNMMVAAIISAASYYSNRLPVGKTLVANGVKTLFVIMSVFTALGFAVFDGLWLVPAVVIGASLGLMKWAHINAVMSYDPDLGKQLAGSAPIAAGLIALVALLGHSLVLGAMFIVAYYAALIVAYNVVNR